MGALIATLFSYPGVNAWATEKRAMKSGNHRTSAGLALLASGLSKLDSLLYI